MPTIRVWNPPTPRPRKKLSYDQVKARQDRAVDFLDNTHQPDLADEIEGLSVREYAERKGYKLINNSNPRKERNSMAKREELNATLQRINDTLESLPGELSKRMNRANPRLNSGMGRVNPDGGNGGSGGQKAAATAAPKQSRDVDKILNRVDSAASFLADNDPDAALDALNDLLDDYDRDTEGDDDDDN